MMHMLSTEIHLRKWKHVLMLAVFHLFHADFQPAFRFLFPLFMMERGSYSSISLRTIHWRAFGPLFARQNAEKLTRERRLIC